ncbi:MAG: aspartate kinase [Mesonia hippocampi]|uniref:aspartate kinase n=1 Tax=Mesonia hippocampi TaxID=1628250 RepID=UPI003F9A53F9
MKTINIVVFGIGNVGSTLVNQLIALKEIWENEREIELNIPVILNSTLAFYTKEGASSGWETNFEKFGVPYRLPEVVTYIKEQKLENLIAIDVTASAKIVEAYPYLIENGFHIIAANKVANTKSQQFYKELRELLKVNQRKFLYETNVGAGLPIIDTLQKLVNSGDKVTNVRGVFSGSLSYLFNTFSDSNAAFSEILADAKARAYTEPDPRIDLSGVDVARKLLIIARELKLEIELTGINVESLVPKTLNGNSTLDSFYKNITLLDHAFSKKKENLVPDKALRYVADLNVQTQELNVNLLEVDRSSPLGALKAADTLFEIHSSAYKDKPLIIQGAGAGTTVTARGIITDLLSLTTQLNN